MTRQRNPSCGHLNEYSWVLRWLQNAAEQPDHLWAGRRPPQVAIRRSGPDERRPARPTPPSRRHISGIKQVSKKIPVVWRSLDSDADHAEQR